MVVDVWEWGCWMALVQDGDSEGSARLKLWDGVCYKGVGTDALGRGFLTRASIARGQRKLKARMLDRAWP